MVSHRAQSVRKVPPLLNDDPSHGEQLRAPSRTPPCLIRFAVLEIILGGSFRPRRLHQRRCRDFCRWHWLAHPSLVDVGLPVDRPLEAYPQARVGAKLKYVKIDDLMVVAHVEALRSEIRLRTYSYLHFGLPCPTWGRGCRLNGWTRIKGMLMGNTIITFGVAIGVCSYGLQLPGSSDCCFSQESTHILSNF